MHRPAYTTPEPGSWRPAPPPLTPVRRWLSRRLRRAGATLRRTAHWLAHPPETAMHHVPQTLPHLEYHADSGAPEGALYVDGEYVGRLEVTRL